MPVANVIGEIDGGWAVARTVLANESAFIGGGPKVAASTNLRSLAEQAGRTADPVIRQALADIIGRERIASWMGEQIQQAIRRGEMPPIDPGLIKLMSTDNRVRAGNLAMTLRGAAATAGATAETVWAQTELSMRVSTNCATL